MEIGKFEHFLLFQSKFSNVYPKAELNWKTCFNKVCIYASFKPLTSLCSLNLIH